VPRKSRHGAVDKRDGAGGTMGSWVKPHRVFKNVIRASFIIASMKTGHET